MPSKDLDQCQYMPSKDLDHCSESLKENVQGPKLKRRKKVSVEHAPRSHFPFFVQFFMYSAREHFGMLDLMKQVIILSIYVKLEFLNLLMR